MLPISKIKTLSTHKLDRLFKKIIFWAFNLLLVITPFIFTWFNQELFEFNKMIFVYLMTIIITSAWITRMIVKQKLIFKHTALDWPLLALVISQTLATIFSIHQRTSFFGYYTRFNGGLLSTLTYALLYWSFISNFSIKHTRLLLKNTLLAAIGVSLYAIPEHFGVSPSCLIIRGNLDVNCWIQDVRHRVFASFGQPNWLAAYLITLIPLSIAFYLNWAIKKTNTLIKTKAGWWFLTTITLFIALLFTNSRSGILGLGFGLGIFLVLNFKTALQTTRSISFKSKPLIKKTLTVFIALGLILLIVGTDFTPNFTGLLKKITKQPNATQINAQEATNARTTANPNIVITSSEKIRYIVWHGAIKIWQRYPIFGSGPGTFAYSYYLDRPMEHNLVSEWDFLYNKAHNELLNYLATSGTVGLLAYLWLLGTIFYHGFATILNHKKHRSQPKTQLMINAILAGILGLSVSNFLGFSTVMVSALMIILAAALFIFKSQETKIIKDSKTTRLNPFQILTLFSLFLITLFLTFNVVRIWQADYYLTKGKTSLAIGEYDQSLSYLNRAILLSPNEALFYDELASTYAEVVSQLVQAKETEAAKEFAGLAIAANDKALRLNERHLNFYKTRSAIFSKLSALNESYLQDAQEALQLAQILAPTDPKMVYQEGLVALALSHSDEAITLIQRAIDMKPNYHQAYYQLGQIYEQQQAYASALEQYRFILDYLIPNDNNLQKKIKALQALIKNQSSATEKTR